MSSENGKTVFEEAAAERQLEELRRGIEEWRRRRRSANDAFDAFVKRFDEAPQTAGDEPPPVAAVPAPKVSPPAPVAQTPPRYEEPPHRLEEPRPRLEKPRTDEPRADDRPVDDGLLAFAPAASAEAPVPRPAEPQPPERPSLADFAAERPATPSTELRSIPAALAPSRRSPLGRIGPIVALAAAGVVLAAFLWRGRSPDEAVPATAVAAPPAAEAPAPPPPMAPPTAEVTTIRRVWLRVTVDGARVVEREVPAETKIPFNAASQIVIRAGDAGAVRVAIGGKDQGPLGPAGQVATRTFAVK